MEYNIQVEQALACIKKHVQPIRDTETIPITEANMRVLAQDIYANFDQPPFPRSPIDGYACRAKDLVGASKEHPVHLQVHTQIDAGMYYEQTIPEGSCVRIMTGAPIPASLDCCVYQEKTDYGESVVAIYEAVASYGNYAPKGEDFQKGSLVIAKDTTLTSLEIGLLAALGVANVSVYRKVKVAILTSGDELVDAEETLRNGTIYNANAAILQSRLQQFPVDIVAIHHIRDDVLQASQILQELANRADLIISTGGVSVGKKDIFHEALPMAKATTLYNKIAMKPGGPSLFGVLNDTYISCLSGNPFGAMVNLEVQSFAILAALSRSSAFTHHKVEAKLLTPFLKSGGNRRFVRAFYKDGIVQVPTKHASGVLSSLVGCNCLIDVEANSPTLEVNEKVRVWLL